MTKEKLIVSNTFQEKFNYLKVYLSQMDDDLEEFADNTEIIEGEDIVESVVFVMPDCIKREFKEDFPKLMKLLSWFNKQTETEKYESLYDSFSYIQRVMIEFENMFKNYEGDGAWDLVNQFQLHYEELQNIEKALRKTE